MIGDQTFSVAIGIVIEIFSCHKISDWKFLVANPIATKFFFCLPIVMAVARV
jgi:hypothetical protein